MSTLQPAKLGGFGIYPQTALGTEVTAQDFYWFKHEMTDVGPQQVIRELGNLVGGGLLPSGQVKTGAMAGGRISMPPALDDYIGWLFFALAGAAEATPDDNLDGSYTHYFPDKTSGDTQTPQKFLTVHKVIPTDGLYNLGECLIDCTLTRCQLAVAGGQFVTTQWEMLGVEPKAYRITKASPEQGWDPYGAGAGGTYPAKGKASVPIASKGLIQLPVATSLEAAQAMTIDLANVTPGYDDVAVIASYFPHSWPVLNRVPVLQYTQLYTTDDLYRTAFYDGAGSWSPLTFNTSFVVEAQSAELIRAVNDSEQGSPTYTGSAGSETLTDATQDWSDWETTAPGTAAFWVEVTNNDGLVAWAYLGDDQTSGVVDVYKDEGLTVRGWNCVIDPTGGTISGYDVFPNRPYALGFKAMSVDWTATPVPLQGGRLVSLQVRGQLAQAESGLDWHFYLTNKTSAYSWPT